MQNNLQARSYISAEERSLLFEKKKEKRRASYRAFIVASLKHSLRERHRPNQEELFQGGKIKYDNHQVQMSCVTVHVGSKGVQTCPKGICRAKKG